MNCLFTLDYEFIPRTERKHTILYSNSFELNSMTINSIKGYFH